MSGRKVHLNLAAGFTPGRGWRWVRRFTQTLTLLVIALSPLLGGWQRLDRNYLAAWEGHGWDLPSQLIDRLPLGDAPKRAYEVNRLLGGGAAVDYFGVPAFDPVAGLFALTHAPASWKWGVGFALPVLLGLFAGRVFCGWLCPFGTLSRLTEALWARLPWRPRRHRLPERRWLRWLLLGGAVTAGALGAQSLLYLLLPHVVVQHALYSCWLMGGGGAALGWVLGLVAAGSVFGPTAFCAALCPTGAALGLLGRARRFGVAHLDSKRCGVHCDLCSRACWLSLDPASGDPGPDCDACGRCFGVCPKVNMRLGVRRRPVRRVAVAIVLLLAGVLAPSSSLADHAERGESKPRLTLYARELRGDTEVALSLVDLEGVRLDSDDPRVLEGSELSVVMFRGARGGVDERGKLARREIYTGPLAVELAPAQGPTTRVELPEPNEPYSTATRAIFRRRLPITLHTGDRVVLEPVPGWLEQPCEWQVQPSAAGRAPGSLWHSLLVAFLGFSGLLSLALVLGGKNRQEIRSH